jgi:hypothetical protein
VPAFNLTGSWDWLDRHDVPTGCLVRFWEDDDRWRAWVTQDHDVPQTCTRLDYRLDRVDIGESRVSLWFLYSTRRFATRSRFEIVTPRRLKALSGAYALVKRSDQTPRPCCTLRSVGVKQT